VLNGYKPGKLGDVNVPFDDVSLRYTNPQAATDQITLDILLFSYCIPIPILNGYYDSKPIILNKCKKT